MNLQQDHVLGSLMWEGMVYCGVNIGALIWYFLIPKMFINVGVELNT